MEASNIEKLRNIINNISRLNDEWFDTYPTDEGQTGIHDAITCEVVEADKILAAPPRNCDVGTAEEQAERFKNFCTSHYNRNNVDGECDACPLKEVICAECEFAWAQMPYEEGGEK